jgi:general secretion pathway protein B
MSYILDALKRADAERERGQVPGLHSQASVPTPSAAPRRVATRWPVGALLGVGLLLVAAGLWWNSRPGEPTVAVQPPPIAAPVERPLPAAEPPAAGRPLPPSVAQEQLPGLTPAQPILAPTPAPGPPSSTATSAPARTAPAIAPPSEAKALPALPGDTDAGVRRFADLSPQQRAQLPQLSVAGASYSANPAHRMLIVNGAVVHEGQEVAPGMTLERIGLHEAVIRQGSLRFSIAY